MRSVNFERSTSVLSMTPPGLAIRAAILIPSTALGKDEYWKLTSESTSLNCTLSHPAVISIATASSFISAQPSSVSSIALRRRRFREKVKRLFFRSAAITASSSASASLNSGMPPDTKRMAAAVSRRSRSVRSADMLPRRRSERGAVENRMFVESSS